MKHKTLLVQRCRQTLILSLAAGLILSQPVYGSAQPDTSNTGSNTPDSFEDQILTRVDQVNENGLVRSHLEDSDGNIYTDHSTTEESSSKSSLKKAADLPATYDLRNYNLTTSIKDQGYSGCCWAFSAVKAIESNGLKLGLLTPETADFSENHLAWFSYSPSTDTADPLYGDGISVSSSYSFQDFVDSLFGTSSASAYPYINGGSAILASFTLAKWSGLERENMAPFDASTEQLLYNMAADMSQKENLRYNSYAHMQNAISFDEYLVGEKYYYQNTGLISQMKQSIIDNGAMSVALYYATKNVTTTENGTAYYQTDYSGYNAIQAANHCVTIIGWDDHFSRNNFSTPPAADGAWLIANSYGTEYGDEGYFWLSYYDQSISDCYTFLAESADNYDNIYQYDGFGWGNANYSTSSNIKAANIFTADSKSPQQLRAVSFYTLTDNQPYKIQIYRGVSSKPTNGTLISECTTTGTMEHNGYHTVPLSSPVNIKAGETFSVVITYIQSGSSPIYVPFEGRNVTDSGITFQYSSKKGQSFLFTKISNISSRKWYDLSALGYNNVCIKAFTDNTTTAKALPKVKKKITLGKGETFQLSSSYDSYTSNDTALLSATNKGKITAKKVGVSTISLSNGNSKSLVQVTVKKAPSSVKLSAGKKKTVKKGKTFRLKTKLSSGSASYKITYRSSKKRVATVSASGKVKALRPGTTVIKVRTYNGKTARLKLTVK